MLILGGQVNFKFESFKNTEKNNSLNYHRVVKSQATSNGDFMHAFLGCYLAIQPPLK